jgi:tetratricopeptide (TPR) repeat protein
VSSRRRRAARRTRTSGETEPARDPGEAGPPGYAPEGEGLEPEGPDGLHRRGRRLAAEGDHSAAVALLARAVEARPERAAWHQQLARSLELLGDLREAEERYVAAIERDSRATWHARLARVRERLDDLPGAAAAYQEAVDLDPTRANWHARLGDVRKKLRDWAGAAVAYQAATLRDASHPRWYIQLGHALERGGDWPAATLAYRQADAVATGDGPDRPTRQLPLQRRAYLDLVSKPQYAHGVLRAATLAAKLGVGRIAAIEFGVAGGNGLVALETHAAEVEAVTGVAVEVIGFDTGEGLFEPVDHRDMPYMFAAGNYVIDVPKLESRLRSASLVLGDAATTFGAWLTAGRPPIGFMSFDMDVYSATSAVLAHLGDTSPAASLLPRTNVYFDDVFGFQGQDYNRFTGELLAIDEFNDGNASAKLAEDRTFRSLPVNAPWHHGMYMLHRFDHGEYPTYISPADRTSLALRDDG